MQENNKGPIAFLPCAGTEKVQGIIAALVTRYCEENNVLQNAKFSPSLVQLAADLQLVKNNQEEIAGYKWIVINGCGEQCVNKILINKAIKPYYITSVNTLLKETNITLQKSLKTQELLSLIPVLVDQLIKDFNAFESSLSNKKNQEEHEFSPEFNETKVYTYTKFKFKVPIREGTLYYSWNDTWVYLDGDIAWMGITDFLQQNLSDILMVELPEIGKSFSQMDAIGTVESSKTVNEMITPFSGEVIKINNKLLDNPELINSDPYTKGWILAMKLTDYENEKENVMSGEEYFKEMQQKVLEKEK
jgi:glycine cleavage system H protein